MLKTSFLLVLICFVVGSVRAQLPGTSWKGTFNIPDPAACIFKFYQDSVNLIYAGDQAIPLQDQRVVTGKDSAVLESMSYKVIGDTLILVKQHGMSPCGTEAGRYKILLKSDQLTMTLVTDVCGDRSNAFPDKLDRVKPKE